MNYKVVKSFIDKLTGKGYNKGSTYTSSDDVRAAFLVSEGYLQSEESNALVTSKNRPDALKNMNMTELRKIAKNLSIKSYTKMKEDELIQAILSAENATGDGVG